MLKTTRRPGESVFINLADDIEPSTPVAELFDQPIEFRIIRRRGDKVLLAVEADEKLTIWRK